MAVAGVVVAVAAWVSYAIVWWFGGGGVRYNGSFDEDVGPPADWYQPTLVVGGIGFALALVGLWWLVFHIFIKER